MGSSRISKVYGVVYAFIALLLLLTPCRQVLWLEVAPFAGVDVSQILSPKTETRAGAAPSFQVQLARAMPAVGRTDNAALFRHLDGLRVLIRRYPGRPSAYAAFLRAASPAINGDMDRPEARLMDPEAGSAMRHEPDSPALMAEYDSAAAEGALLDPTNAFFPTMRAAELFAAGRDSDALAAVECAGHDSDWNDYTLDELHGRWTDPSSGSGVPSAVAHAMDVASVGFPNFLHMFSTAQLAAYHAMQLEQSGDTAGGLRLRIDVIRIGELMRLHGTTVMVTEIGADIPDIAIERPGGAPAITGVENTSLSAKLLVEKRVTAFIAYLRQTGHQDAIVPITDEIAAGRSTITIARHAARLDISRSKDTMQLMESICAGGVLFLNTGWLLVFVGLACVVQRLEGKRRQELYVSLAIGVAVGIAAGRLFAGDWGERVAYLGALVIAVGGMIVYRTPSDNRGWLLSLVASGAGGMLGAWSIGALLTRQLTATGIKQAILLDLSLAPPATGTWAKATTAIQHSFVSEHVAFDTALPIVLPVLLAGVSALIWFVRRARSVQTGPTFTQMYGSAGTVLAAILAIGFAGHIVVCTVQNQAIDHRLQALFSNPLAYSASEIHKGLPGPVDWSHVHVL
ncbi:MAG: hypothetical protein ACLQVD_02770 [Capsulimonadaceae bacterium]